MMFATKQEYITIRYVSFVRTRMNVVGMRMMMKSNYYDWYKSHGICPRCRKEDAAKGHVYCLNCLDEQALLQMELRANLSDEKKADILKKQNESNKKRYARLKAEGICPNCGKRKARIGMVFCAYCGGKQAEAKKIKYHSRKEGKQMDGGDAE